MKRVVAIEYSSDGKYLYIARNGGRVELWSTFTKKCLAILKAFNAIMFKKPHFFSKNV